MPFKFSAALPRSASPGQCLVVLMVLTLAAMCAVFALVMIEGRANVRRVAEMSELNLATALAQDLARNVEALDLSLQAARDSWNDPRVQALDAELRQLVIFDHSATASYIHAVLVVGVDGNVEADSRSLKLGGANFAHADFFEAQRDRDVGLFISQPMHLAGQAGWVMAFSYRITAPDGRFAGVSVGFLDLGYLAAAYARLPLGPGGAITLFKTDGTLLVREPANARSIGKSFLGQAAFEPLARGVNGVFEGMSSVDGQGRLFAFQRVGTLPLTQAVGASTASIYAEWNERAMTLGLTLAALCGLTLASLVLLKRELGQRVKAEKALSKLASTDDLTGLLNRRRFFELADGHVAKAADTGAGLSVLMIDADHFKSYNDRYGHLAGDVVLTVLGRCIAGELRAASDLAARYGGEEFIVLLPGTGGSRAFVIAEAIRTAIAGLAMPHELSVAGVVTVSVGLASVDPGRSYDLRALVETADAELYRAKSAGRNRSTGGGVATLDRPRARLPEPLSA